MMDFDSAFELFEELEDTSSRLQKETILRENLDNEAFTYLLRIVNDPYITFGIDSRSISDKWTYNKETLSIDTNIVSVLEHVMKNNTGTNKEKILVSSYVYSYEDEYLWFKWLKRVFLKNLRIGVTGKTLRKVYGKDFVPLFEVQGAVKFKEFPYHYIEEPKIDGIRCLAFLSKSEVKLRTQNGKKILGFVEIETVLKDSKLTGYIFDGEIQSHGDFSLTMENLFTKTSNKTGIFHVFDILTDREFDIQEAGLPLYARKEELNTLFNSISTLRRSFVVRNVEYKNSISVEVQALAHLNDIEKKNYFLQERLASGLEGSIIKDMNGLYEFKKSSTWQKIKPSDTIDLEIRSVHEGKGKYENMLGKVLVIFNGVDVYVGGGFSDEQRENIWNDSERYIGEVIEIEYHHMTKDGSLREPRFKRFRFDK